MLRAEDITLTAGPAGNAETAALAGEVVLWLFEGKAVNYEVVVEGLAQPLRVASRDGGIASGSRVWPS